MEQTGYVTEKNDNVFKVRVDRESACGGNCVSCKGCPNSAVIVECVSDEDVEVGDLVALVMEDSKFFKRLFLGFGVMTLLSVAGAVVCYTVFKTEGASVLGALAGLFAGFTMIKRIFKGKNTEITLKRIEK